MIGTLYVINKYKLDERCLNQDYGLDFNKLDVNPREKDLKQKIDTYLEDLYTKIYKSFKGIERPKDVEIDYKTYHEKYYFINVRYSLLLGKSKEEALNQNLDLKEDVSLEGLQAIKIFLDSTSFSDTLDKVQEQTPKVQAIALNLSESFYPYIDYDFITKLKHKIKDDYLLSYFNLYLFKRNDFMSNIIPLTRNSKIVYIEKDNPGSLTFIGKDKYAIYNYFINESMFNFFYDGNFPTDYYLTGDRNIRELSKYLRNKYCYSPIHKDIIKLFDFILKPLDDKDLDYFIDTLIPLTQKILTFINGNVKTIKYFDSLYDFTKYLKDNNIKTKLFKQQTKEKLYSKF